MATICHRRDYLYQRGESVSVREGLLDLVGFSLTRQVGGRGREKPDYWLRDQPIANCNSSLASLRLSFCLIRAR
jgi:hypothetical protein